MIAALVSMGLLFQMGALPPVPSITYDIAGVGAETIKPPEFRLIPGAKPTMGPYCIHARIEHDEASGTTVRVWITPGLSPENAPMESCSDNDLCTGPKPDPATLQRLFSMALNRALSARGHELGHYRITRCDPPPTTRDFGWLELSSKAPLQVDGRFSYGIASYQDGAIGQMQQYELAINAGRYPRVRFIPLWGDTGLEGLSYVWSLCEENELETIRFVTKLRVVNLREQKRAPMAEKF